MEMEKNKWLCLGILITTVWLQAIFALFRLRFFKFILKHNYAVDIYGVLKNTEHF